MSITDYPRASVSFPRDRRLGERDCILVISENNNNPGLFCTLSALISRFFKWTEIKFILSRDTQKHLTFYSKFIPVLLQNTVKKGEKYRYYSWPRMLGDWKWRPKMLSNSAILCYTFWAEVSLPSQIRDIQIGNSHSITSIFVSPRHVISTRHANCSGKCRSSRFQSKA